MGGRRRDGGARSASEGAWGAREHAGRRERHKAGRRDTEKSFLTSYLDITKSHLFSLSKLIQNLPVNLQVKFTCEIYL